jgi:ABC-type amino acid transport substrate-binding protein
MNRIFSRLMMCFSLALLFFGCGSSSGNGFRIAIDPNWYPEDFHGQTQLVNGFVEELLLDIAKTSGLEIERIGTSWDNTLEGLRKRRYEGALATLPPYNFNAAKYDFSSNILDIGPVLLAGIGSKAKGIKDMANEVVGVVGADQIPSVFQKYPSIIMRTFDTPIDALSALANQEIQGLIIDRLTAVSFLRGNFAAKVKIVGAPLSNSGIHLVSLKEGSSQADVKLFNKTLERMIKKKKLQKLQQKWQLTI